MQTESRSAATLATLDAVDRFNTAFNSHDVEAIMNHMTSDCIFESTSPAPDGRRYEGQAAVRAVWEDLFRASPDARFEAEEITGMDDRCVVRWRYTFGDAYIRGVDIIRVREGKVAEKLAYVKG